MPCRSEPCRSEPCPPSTPPCTPSARHTHTQPELKAALRDGGAAIPYLRTPPPARGSTPPPSIFALALHSPAYPPAMALRFSANLSWLFPELPALPARLEAAARAGFEAVEAAWPEGCPAPALHAAAERAGLRVVLLNTPPGDGERGEMGLGAVPGRQDAFRQGLAAAVRYAHAVGCPR